MIPYYSIFKESGYDRNAGFHYFSVTRSSNTYTAVEYYCTNPACSCSDVLLELNRVLPNGTTERIGELFVSLPDFRVNEITFMPKARRTYKSMMDEGFEQGIPEEWKPHILTHHNRVKQMIGAATQESREALTTLSLPMSRSSTPGRNDACPCGSGKKYKKCCGSAAQ